MERLTGKDKEETYLKLQGCAKGEKVWCIDDREFINAKYGKQLLNKLCAVEDLMEKYGIESMEELDKLINIWKLRDVVDKMEKPINSLCEKAGIVDIEKDRNTWKKACELMAKQFIKDDGTEMVQFTDTWDCVHNSKETIDYFYKQAQKENKDDD